MSNAKPESVQTIGLKSSLAALAAAASHESLPAEPAGWTLPSGEDLLHYALNGGFLAPNILSAAGARTLSDLPGTIVPASSPEEKR